MLDFDPKKKSDRVLAAALELFKQYGFRRTSMDDIAKAADMSRPALYLLFANKTDIFRSLSERFHQKTLAMAKDALTQDAVPEQRICAAIKARMLPLYRLAHESLHGQELSNTNQSLSADISASADLLFLEILSESLQTAINTGEIAPADHLAARELAQVLQGMAQGLKPMAFSAKDYERLLENAITTLFHGLKGQRKA
ncbi:MAG TPA: TetR/AcrR family transcriptional regulator [Rhizobiales bacterium]|nr:TetR/AcrR family transcriptional regulator [Hyphomicrobiales bacterium]